MRLKQHAEFSYIGNPAKGVIYRIPADLYVFRHSGDARNIPWPERQTANIIRYFIKEMELNG